VAHDYVPLKLLNLIATYDLVFERTETGRNSVRNLAAIEKSIDSRR
jgi:hypothetical protein